MSDQRNKNGKYELYPKSVGRPVSVSGSVTVCQIEKNNSELNITFSII